MLGYVLRFSIQHRFLVVLIVTAIAAFGIFSFQRLPIDAVPDITNNQVQINTLAPSLSPAEIERQVTLPIETALSGIPGLRLTRSISRNGFSQVQAVFEDDVNIYFARQQINERLAEAKNALPPGAEPSMGAIATGLGEVYQWTVEYEHPWGEGAEIHDGNPGWQSDGSYLTPEWDQLLSSAEQLGYLRTVQDWIIRPQLKSVKDVAGVDSIGGYEKQFQVQPDPMKMISHGLTFHDLIEALERNNVSTGAGYIEHNGESYLVRSVGRIENEQQIAQIVIASRNGTPVRVSDVATVGFGRELRTGTASENGREVVVGTAIMLIGANSRTVAASVDQKMALINKTLPPDIRAKTVLNRTKLVDATIKTVRTNLAEGAILVIIVLFLLLGNFRAALITALAIPLSMLITATGMVQANISGNLMSLGAIDFGLIVDGAVIVVENCLRRLGEKQHDRGGILPLRERLETVLASSKEMIRPALFGQAIIITVYLPILTLTGIEGKMFKPMALTVVLALIAALVLSLTFVPAMVALLVRGRVSEQENFLIRLAKRGYAPLLQLAVRWRWAIIPAAVLVFVASLWLFTRLGQEFVPTLDEQDMAIEGLRVPSVSLTQSTQMELEVERLIKEKFPEVAFVFSKTGTAEMASDPMGPNSSDTFIILKPRDQWRSEADLRQIIERREKELGIEAEGKSSKEEEEEQERIGGHKGHLIRLMELELRALPGNGYEFTQPIQMRFNELIAGVRGDVAVKVYGDDIEKLMPTAQTIARILATVEGATGPKIEQTTGQPLLDIQVDRAAIARYGLSVADVQDVIAAAIGGREAGQVFEGDRRFDLVVRLPDQLRDDFHGLRNLPIPLPRAEGRDNARFTSLLDMPGELTVAPAFIPLSSVARIKAAEGPNQISRENGKRRMVVQTNVRGRDIGSFVAEAQRKIEQQVKLPPGYWLEWGGQFENLAAARRRLSVVVPACLFLIFILLFSTFNSVKYAVIVFSGVPLALTGGIVALWLRDMPFSITAAVGFIALSGVAVLNGLVMVSYINQLRATGLRLEAAVVEGAMTRLRPVLMTALVASLGFVPMALATGPGAEVQKPLATVVIGGIISSTLLTLLVLPALYRLTHFHRPFILTE
ncbi:MAG TPA: CusA/CzcA family heavy metal efflux RND transporter [Tepidisphaeraceae bacterium]|nr:CusA/CzcA family heavy metal efflux RND transporter [Tepidisphaeraceae bacterium]